MATKSGLSQAVDMIGGGITETLKMNLGQEPLDLDALTKVDGYLLRFFEQNLRPQQDSEERKDNPP